jgi:hypothetical protein
MNEILPELGDREQGPAFESAAEDEAVPQGIAEAAARAALEAVAGESEEESELNPVRRWYSDAMLEHLAHNAAEAESEDAAGEAFLPLIPLVASKLLPLAAKAAPAVARAMPRIAQAVSRVTPQLTRGVVNVAKTMFRSPAGKRLLRTIPTIAQRTIGQLARQVAAGQPLTAQSAVRALAGQTARILQQPARVRRVVNRSGVYDRRFHQTIPTAVSTATTAIPRCGKPGGCRCVCGGCRCS